MLNHNLNKELLGIDSVIVPDEGEIGTTNSVKSCVLLFSHPCAGGLLTSADAGSWRMRMGARR